MISVSCVDSSFSAAGGGRPCWGESQFTTLDVPDAISTSARGINDRGEIVGVDPWGDDFTHGFLLANGVYKSIDVPHASRTEASGINLRGEIVGIYQDALGGTDLSSLGVLHTDRPAQVAGATRDEGSW